MYLIPLKIALETSDAIAAPTIPYSGIRRRLVVISNTTKTNKKYERYL
jgi:hypothetical protein